MNCGGRILVPRELKLGLSRADFVCNVSLRVFASRRRCREFLSRELRSKIKTTFNFVKSEQGFIECILCFCAIACGWMENYLAN